MNGEVLAGVGSGVARYLPGSEYFPLKDGKWCSFVSGGTACP